MALIPLEHPRRLRSPAEAETFMRRGLREARVSASGFYTTDPEQIIALVDAVDFRFDNTVSFEGGDLDHGALGNLAQSPYKYLDMRTHGGSLRVWPDRYSWVYLDGGQQRLETTSIPEALAAFAAHPAKKIERGFIKRISKQAKPHLLAFLLASHTEVHAAIEVAVEVARELTELFRGEQVEWRIGDAMVDFPSGKIHGFLKTPNIGDKHRAKWRARIEKALQRAGLAV